ncbi:hypothetical protein NJB14197_29620 [Mycobacterium montefiorense]|uniref:Uncharacterized protein n=1 Tax=Mycobacterium montefiorense TaxID=154654 RepID=A0AA37PRQ7_9MYCO|nr:hypothetical protein MmonteBS_01860 [Mycobacterium montefiorense]GKU35964.1 hypothetical protein NJB14191_33100 [Mycobacterium montefiorense]GKU41570.1 hypothetical protein NJB14192_35540 [Mycobacterium montefiorense]GKU44404.1 hypothetical protein NJB14194_10320 [Mycobacterium montefiorense]GKU51908.1 hypothetical protein NJB14195_31520 [Mycobacterium montefiorense]
MVRMCETRRGVLAIPNKRGTSGLAVRDAAEKHARASLTHEEQFAEGSIEVESQSPRLDDETVRDVYYAYKVMTPGCTGWSTQT